jgi:hypothetical protein
MMAAQPMGEGELSMLAIRRSDRRLLVIRPLISISSAGRLPARTRRKQGRARPVPDPATGHPR